jgi:hypothetical protein
VHAVPKPTAHTAAHPSPSMVSYGLRDEEEDTSEQSIEVPAQSLSRESRKRRYPVAFPDEVSPYRGEEGDHERATGLIAMMDCFSLVFSWMGQVGGRIFTIGTRLSNRELNAVGSWLHKEEGQVKRQRITSPPTQHHELDETSPLLPPLTPQQQQPSRSTTYIPPPRRSPSPNTFLAGSPHISSARTCSPPLVPRTRRFPQPTRIQRLRRLQSQSQNSSSVAPGDALRRPRPGPYDRVPQRKTSQREAEERLLALETRARELTRSQVSPTPASYAWNDDLVQAEFLRSRGRLPRATTQVTRHQESPSPEAQQFEFKFSTPLPTKFDFGGQFTSPPKSAVPEYVRQEEGDVDRGVFKFSLPPRSKERVEELGSPKMRIPGKKEGLRGTKTQLKGIVNGEGQWRETERAEKYPPRSAQIAKDTFARPTPPSQTEDTFVQPTRRRSQTETDTIKPPRRPSHPETNTVDGPSHDTTSAKPRRPSHFEEDVQRKTTNFFDRLPAAPSENKFIRKTLPPKVQKYTYNLDLTSQSSSFPPPTSTILPVDAFAVPTTPPELRRTKSNVVSPMRSSRRKITQTYASDSHREFFRDLRELLGQTKAKREVEEREIELQIQRLREEEKVIEKTLVGELPKLPEILSRKVCPK